MEKLEENFIPLEKKSIRSKNVNSEDRVINLNDEELKILSLEIRKDIFRICQKAKSGHLGGNSSATELLTTLYFGGILQYGVKSYNDRDRVLIRGHIGPLRYKIFNLLGYLEKSELSHYRKHGSRLPGHENHLKTPGVDVTPSGSLGMILSYGAGCALASKKKKSNYKTFVFIGDGEEQEGNISEAARHIAHMKLGNIIAIIDDNRKQLSNPTSETDSSNVATIWKGYGWDVIELGDGHNVSKIRSTYSEALGMNDRGKKPILIIAKTEKGKHLEGYKKHFSGYHTIGTCSPSVVESTIEGMNIELKKNERTLLEIKSKIDKQKKNFAKAIVQGESSYNEVNLDDIEPNEKTIPNPDFCQLSYFTQLGDKVESGKFPKDPFFYLTADVTREDHVKMAGIERFAEFLNVGIREQHMIAMAHGLSLSLPKARIMINSMDAFVYRSMDQLHAAIQGKSNMIIVGDVSGLTNSKNGKTHQTSAQPGALLMMPGITFLEPYDVDDTFNCFNWAVGKSKGIVYLRIHRFNVKQKLVCENRNVNWYVARDTSKKPDLTIVASGLVMDSVLEAAEILSKESMNVKIINVINHKSLDREFVKAVPNGVPMLTVYNGCADVLLSNVSKVLLQERSNLPSKIIGRGFDVGASGSLYDLLEVYKLDAKGIVKTVKEKCLNEFDKSIKNNRQLPKKKTREFQLY